MSGKLKTSKMRTSNKKSKITTQTAENSNLGGKKRVFVEPHRALDSIKKWNLPLQSPEIGDLGGKKTGGAKHGGVGKVEFTTRFIKNELGSGNFDYRKPHGAETFEEFTT